MSEYDTPDSSEIQDIFALCGSGNLEAVINHFNNNEDFRKPSRISLGLHAAVEKYDLEIARFCLQHGALVNDEIAGDAALLRSIPLFELFVWYGWDINSYPGGDGDTVLFEVFDDEELLLWLLDHGCNPNIGAPDKDSAYIPYITTSGTPLNQAAKEGNITAFDILLKYDARLENCKALHVAARTNHGKQIPMMKHLLALGMDVNGFDAAKGRASLGAPLYIAIDAGVVENVRFLLENGADPRAGEPRWTALQVAEQRGCQEIVELIKKALQPGVEEQISSLSVS
jgi:ankyrin repeat protein